MLAGNIANNSIENVWCHHNAVGATSGEIESPQFDYGRPLGFGSVEFSDHQGEALAQERQHDSSKREFVNMLTIDSLHLEDVRLIKVDVEGMEDQVLKGAAETIRTHRPFMEIEYLKANLDEVLKFLAVNEYNAFLHKPSSVLFCSPKEDSYIFKDLPLVVLPS